MSTPLSYGAELLRRTIARFITGKVEAPYHSIGMIDSRAFDPEWEYRNQYKFLSRIMGYALGDSNKGQTAASNESYRWGWRGGRPADRLTEFSGDVDLLRVPREIWKRFKDFALRQGGRGLRLVASLDLPRRRPGRQTRAATRIREEVRERILQQFRPSAGTVLSPAAPRP